MLQNNVNRLLLNFICMISVNVLNLKLSILCWVFSLLWYATWYMYMQCLQWKILGIWIKISELSLAVISFLLTFLYLYQAYHKIVIFDTIKTITFRNLKMHRVRCSNTEKWKQKAGIPWRFEIFLIFFVLGTFVDHFLFIIATWMSFVISTNLTDIRYMVRNVIPKLEVMWLSK